MLQPIILDFCWFVELSNSLKWMRIMKDMLRLVLKIYSVEPAESRRLLCALLDVGLIRTTTGNSVFGALEWHWMVDLTFLTVTRGLLDLTRSLKNLTLRFTGSTSMVAMSLHT